ncbi:MAG TPA: cupin domain-containing protein [Thiopseudomonas sp.]|nr:cupin domain-containing protein [Thiopseudomonas sp.]HZJ93942.1 cupin domain-containing protein [Thiopseudomonas sp.]
MQFNSDFSQPVVIQPNQYQFIDSPLAGVSRMILERAGNEVARATSIVRYAPGSGYSAHTQFDRHIHAGGEEILVLEGMFCDEHGQYPTGSWLRNPRYSAHAPFTLEQGALIYVKVGHIDAGLMGDRFIHPPTLEESAQ